MKTRWKVAIWVLLLFALIVLGLPAMQAKRDAERMTSSRNNLKQLGVALHNYHDVFDALPLGGDTGTDGLIHHSWQFRLVPYMEGGVFRPVDDRYAWNDPYNAPYFKLPFSWWLIPGVKQCADNDSFAVSHYAGNAHWFGMDRVFSMKNIRGGASQSVLAGEVADGFAAWGRPGNWRDPAKGLTGREDAFGSAHPAGVQFVMLDGSVRVIQRHVDQRVLRALAAGGDDGENHQE